MNAHEPPHPSFGRSLASPRMRRFLWAAVAVAVVGEGGHQLFDRYGTAFGHHAFHIFMVGAAAMMFAAIVYVDIRRNGRPRFSWRLHPADAGRPPRR
jgi:hypothetical protein